MLLAENFNGTICDFLYTGTKAYRDVKEGSWFVTALCKVLKEQAHSEDLLSMMTKVTMIYIIIKTNFKFCLKNALVSPREASFIIWGRVPVST